MAFLVFSGSLLQEATVVTEGKRYAFLPFLYDEEAAKIRQNNSKFLSNEIINYNESSDETLSPNNVRSIS